MADSYQIIDDEVIPYSGSRKDTDTNSWRDATTIELDQQERIRKLEFALSDLISSDEDCDEFPQHALEDASRVLDTE